MSARLAPGVAVLVIGPTITNSLRIVGRNGVIERWVCGGDPLGSSYFAGGPGWRVEFERPVAPASVLWRESFHAIFPATSLMPLDGQAEPEAIATAEPVHEEVSHAG